ncbi:TrbI/VirB10 family protein [Fusobacterium animalis]|uniref:Conjugal transfer protein TrbI n=1 Tax=Fusobacterium animalis TaxID=76859 RepID=A0A2B7YTR0_9FUSO|nr:TrbI/VirB10 family protein [Fusobacterium animalis]PGH24705.1 conjugal transfer protein TrbI [Fusobacterium animalis]
MDFNNNQNEPQNQENSNMNYQPKKGTFFKKKIVYGFFMFIVLLIIFLTFRKEIFSSNDNNQNNKKVIKNEVAKENENPNLDNAQYGEEDMQDLSYDERDENGGLTEEELNYPVQGNDEENIAEQKSSEEIERENRLKQLQAESDAAFRSPTTITIANRPQTQEVDNKLLLAKSQANPIQDYDGNRQESKKNFLMNEQAQKFYQTNFLVEQLSEFELKAGDFIPATLQTGINSDLPSKVIVAVVSENVRDTIKGKHILIPQGTRVIGTYDSSVTFGQERLLVIWQRLIFPNGKSIGLDNMQGVDLSGKAGITGEIDNHFGTLLKGVVLSSIMGSAGAIVTDRKNDWRGAAAEGAGEQIVTIGDRFADRALSRQPTINIEPGTRLNIMVHSDLILEPYGE